MHEKPWTIMIVDDEAVNRKVLQAFLQQAGFEVLVAEDGVQARETAHNRLPDLILLDIMMPGESGFETCTRLKAEPRTADIPIIFLSALDDVQSKIQGFQAGSVDYVAKPFYKEEILARVKTHLKLRHAFEQVIAEQAKRLEQIKQGQQKLLVHPEDDPQARYGVYYAPFYEAGGDFYDVFAVNAHTYAYFLGDISGHDLGASMITSAIKALVREYFSPLYTARESINCINNILRRSFFDSGQHMTSVCLILDRKNARAEIISCGHPQVIHMPAAHPPQLVESSGDVLGIFDQVTPGVSQIRISSGDRFLLYSDGLIEHARHNGSRLEGLQDLLQSCARSMFTADIQSAVQAVVRDALCDHELEDDIVALGVEV
ncbi:MAG: SpoIIE family protein phosphatase [Desulfovermiculus sp.]